MKDTKLQVHVLLRYSKKTGKIDTTMTGLGTGMMQLWALNNTSPSKECVIINRETGDVVYRTSGRKDNFPDVEDGFICKCDEIGMPHEAILELTDDRFDEEGR
jgi:hypothetical protein